MLCILVKMAENHIDLLTSFGAERLVKLREAVVQCSQCNDAIYANTQDQTK